MREVVYPVVPGGEETLRKLVWELMASNRVIWERISAAWLLHALLPADAGPGTGR
jgi:hypothetical protein